MNTTAPAATIESKERVQRRSPDQVMRLARMGSFHPTRLSFMRSLLRRIEREQWRFERALWQIDERGVGRAVYTVHGPNHSYSLVAFAHDLPDDMRSDRVIATAWDSTFTLFDGIPTENDLARLEANVPRQEAGRISDRELTLARANRSVRLWSHVIERLAQGKQPDRAQIESVGYLMRTTAVYGSGKFGAADRLATADRAELKAPFQAEMLTVWLIRAFTADLVEHMARSVGGAAATTIDPELRRLLGVGNSTGLGMAPFLVNHPILLNRWICAREEALARVRNITTAGGDQVRAFADVLERARANVAAWHSEHPVQSKKLESLRADLDTLAEHLATTPLSGTRPWDRLYRFAEANLSAEGQEQLVSLMLEPHGELVDSLADEMDADEATPFTIDGAMRLKQLRALIAKHYAWATGIDFSDKPQRGRFWYVSEEKLEPRLGERLIEEGAELELPLAVAEQVQQLAGDLEGTEDAATVASFLRQHPQHRHVLRRIQSIERSPYSEVRDNLIDTAMLPIDLLRCKLSFFGASRFDPRSDRWVRINLYFQAPFPHELCLPAKPSAHNAPSPSASQTWRSPVSNPTFTLAEIQALSRKAARGAGMSWGMADEAGRAVHWLASHGLPGPEALATLLARAGGAAADEHVQPGSASCCGCGACGDVFRCPIDQGASWLDDVETVDAGHADVLGSMNRPLLLLPFFARAAERWSRHVELSWNGLRVRCRPDGVELIGDQAALLDAQANEVTFKNLPADASLSDSGKLLSRSTQARPVDPESWVVLGRLAHRTYVPASDASRAGAGASVRDTD